ncbi:type II toxin-antitoxin system PemI/MazE family antitoxin [Enterococcus olivae]
MKTRRQGNALVLTVPSKFGIEENVEYVAVKGRNEAIVFIKKKDNIFEEAFERGGKIDAGSEFSDDSTVGKEMI